MLITLKMRVGITLAAASLAALVLSFAQSNGPLTRAEVRADLIRVEQAGYPHPQTTSTTRLTFRQLKQRSLRGTNAIDQPGRQRCRAEGEH